MDGSDSLTRLHSKQDDVRDVVSMEHSMHVTVKEIGDAAELDAVNWLNNQQLRNQSLSNSEMVPEVVIRGFDTRCNVGITAATSVRNWFLSWQRLNGSLGNDLALEDLMLQALPAEPAVTDTDQDVISDAVRNPCGTNLFVNNFFLLNSDDDGIDGQPKARLGTDTQKSDTNGYGVLDLDELLAGINGCAD